MILPDYNEFDIKQENIAGDECILVTPKHIGATWDRNNIIFRSSIWRKSDFFPISLSFKKFVNFGEKEDVFPAPKSLKNSTVVVKEDGSTLILSKYKGEFIIRTRGTFDAAKMEKNGFEIQIFRDTILKDYLKINLNNPTVTSATWDYSIIFEWTSPLNKIVIDYGDKPLWYLIGWINHSDYSLLSQSALDALAKSYNWLRPQTYHFNDLVELVEAVKAWKDKEGVCWYHGQNITKVKSDLYLIKHAFKENASLEAVIDFFISYGKPSYSEFIAKLSEQFDYECISQVQGFISQTIDGYKEVLAIHNHMKEFVSNLNGLSRKEQAEKIIAAYGITNRSGMVFAALDNKPLADKDAKKLLFQVLKQ